MRARLCVCVCGGGGITHKKVAPCVCERVRARVCNGGAGGPALTSKWHQPCPLGQVHALLHAFTQAGCCCGAMPAPCCCCQLLLLLWPLQARLQSPPLPPKEPDSAPSLPLDAGWVSGRVWDRL